MFYDCSQSLEMAQVTNHGKVAGTAAVGSGFCQLAAVNSPLETQAEPDGVNPKDARLWNEIYCLCCNLEFFKYIY